MIWRPKPQLKKCFCSPDRENYDIGIVRDVRRIFIEVDRALMHTVDTPVILYFLKKICAVTGYLNMYKVR
jgi:hypothetical protein